MTSPGQPPPPPPSSSGAANISQRQKRMGPAPFASFEDLSDEVRSRLESPEDKNLAASVVRLPGIREDATPTPSTPGLVEKSSPSFAYTGISLIGSTIGSKAQSASAQAEGSSGPTMSTLSAPKSSIKTSTPRIDISRASSSSHHDSRDSTPDRELFEIHDPNSAKLGLGFKEDGALDLRSSTEELDFHGEQSSSHEKRKGGKARPTSPSMHDESYHNHQRKDSQCSDILLLSISGRTSRLSSIGSQGSAQSRLSNASHLSVMSGQSGISRCSSPHKMVLETSFCGTKPPENQPDTVSIQPGTKVESEELEKVLLSRKHDPTEAILAEGISVVDKGGVDSRRASMTKEKEAKAATAPEKPVRRTESKSLQSVKSDITIKVDKPVSDSNNTPKLPKRFVSKSGVEYIYIPLKGPLPVDTETPQPTHTTTTTSSKPKLREVKSATFQTRTPAPVKKQVDAKQKSKSATPSPIIRKKEDEPKYIRIKLKPDYMYSDDKGDEKIDVQKPDSLDLHAIEVQQPSESDNRTDTSTSFKTTDSGKSLSSTPSASPKAPRRQPPAESNIESVTPSPSVSRKSSFASIFKSKEAIISPESPTVSSCKRKNTLTGILRDASENLRERSRSRSKSRDREKSSLSTAPSSTESIDSKSKHKSVLSIFKSSKKGEKSKEDSSSQETLPSIEGIGKVEFKFNDGSAGRKSRKPEAPLQGESIRIPLHSPTYYEDRSFQDWKTSSQDSQETVIEATSRSVNVIVEPIPQESRSNIVASSTTKTGPVDKSVTQMASVKESSRQSSTSSENVVFSTKLGNNNEVFTTKLPKQKAVVEDTEVEITSSVEINGHVTEIHTESKMKKTISTTSVKDMQQLSESHMLAKEKDITPECKKDQSCTPVQETESTSTESKSKRMSQLSQGKSGDLDEDRNSSESERDSEVEFAKGNKEVDLKLDLDVPESERKRLMLQQDSFEDELPYVPTTLPLERSAAVPIVPVKQRSTFEMKTCPIERPRSTTPINPSCLEEYCEEVMGGFNVESVTKTIEKLKISLPKHDSVEKGPTKEKSPRKGSNTNWFDFAEKAGISSPRGSTSGTGDTPPPLPPKGMQKNWINFEEIPEKRKAPKRIQTIPSRGHIDVPDSVLQENVVYNYVNPEECKCECHEINAKNRDTRVSTSKPSEEEGAVQEDELPLLEDDPHDDDKNGADLSDRTKLDVGVSDCRSIISDSSVDLSTSVEPPEANGVEATLRTPFTSDLGVSSNRSSIVSQDESHSPGSPNAFPKIS